MNKKMKTDIVVLADRETWTEIADSKVIINIEIDSEFHYHDDDYDNGQCETLLVQDLLDFWKQHHQPEEFMMTDHYITGNIQQQVCFAKADKHIVITLSGTGTYVVYATKKRVNEFIRKSDAVLYDFWDEDEDEYVDVVNEHLEYSSHKFSGMTKDEADAIVEQYFHGNVLALHDEWSVDTETLITNAKFGSDLPVFVAVI